MRRSNLEIKDKYIIEEILSGSVICRIAMIDGNTSYILPFNYGYRDNCIYIHSAPEGKKIDLLTLNKRVCFEIEYKACIVKDEKPCIWATAYRSVVGYGEVDIITDFQQKQKGLEIILKHNGATGTLSFDTNDVNTIVILKLTITEITGKQSRNWNKQEAPARINLESPRLFFTEIGWEDLEKIHLLNSYPEVDEYNTLGIPDSIETTKDILRPLIAEQQNLPRTFFTWKITGKEEKEFLGLAGLSMSRDRFKIGEIYYKLVPSYWGKGYGTEAAKRIITAGFEDFHLHKIEAGVATENTRSIQVLEKAGMTREGKKRKILPIRGEWKDNYHYAIVEDDKRAY